MRTVICLATLLALTGTYGCSSNQPDSGDSSTKIHAQRQREADSAVSRGEYLVTVGLCHDCHSPKHITPDALLVDSSRMLSGHPAGSRLPQFSTASFQPGNWVQMAPDATAFTGPWGVSYAANLTPDSTTGIGTWTEQNFVQALRTGKHLGQENGRPILPPMPWYYIGRMTDEDLSCIYAYLRSLPPIRNAVPAPTPPQTAQQ